MLSGATRSGLSAAQALTARCSARRSGRVSVSVGVVFMLLNSSLLARASAQLAARVSNHRERCRLKAAFRSQAERRIYAAGRRPEIGACAPVDRLQGRSQLPFI